jgi:hypothetical protein
MAFLVILKKVFSNGLYLLPDVLHNILSERPFMK